MTRHSYRTGAATLGEAVALVEVSSGADTAAIDALESIVSNLRRAREARFELVTRVPTEVLRQVLFDRSRNHS